MSEDSSTMPLQQERRVSSMDFSRLERKVDKLSENLSNLIRFEERQVHQEKRISDTETDIGRNQVRLDFLEKTIDKWINRGIGMWILAGLIWGLVKVYFGAGGH